MHTLRKAFVKEVLHGTRQRTAGSWLISSGVSAITWAYIRSVAASTGGAADLPGMGGGGALLPPAGAAAATGGPRGGGTTDGAADAEEEVEEVEEEADEEEDEEDEGRGAPEAELELEELEPDCPTAAAAWPLLALEGAAR